MVSIGSGARREIEDYELTRAACYATAMQCHTEEGSHARAYFAAQTRRAEVLLPPGGQATLPGRRPWGERLERTFVAHRRYIIRHCPPGSWSVYTATVTETLILEDEFLRHCLPLGRGDLPDGSIGQGWSRHRAGQPWALPVGTAPLEMPHLHNLNGSPLVVWPHVYAFEEMRWFSRWFNGVYLPESLPRYLGAKFPRRIFGVTAASAADSTCKEITGRPAALPAPLRRRLVAAGGFVPLGHEQPEEPRQLDLFADDMGG
jgi:hypothetical protein